MIEINNVSVSYVKGKKVIDKMNLSVKDIKGPKRSKNVMLPRQIAMYIVSELTEYSTTEIGGEFGGRDHTTVVHAENKINSTVWYTVLFLWNRKTAMN